MIYSNIAEYEPGDSILARQTILDLHKEIERLIKNYIALEEEIDDLRKLETTITMENEKLDNIIKEVREYITSYESIETIQQCEHSENNKGLDKDTMIEMTNRYLKVHDKILEILDKEK